MSLTTLQTVHNQVVWFRLRLTLIKYLQFLCASNNIETGIYMSQRHLQDIENELAKNGWEIYETLNGDGYNIAEVWVLSNHRHPNIKLNLAFEGMDELNVLPIEKTYACYIMNTEISLYFYNSKKVWPAKLTEFTRQLNTHASHTS